MKKHELSPNERWVVRYLLTHKGYHSPAAIGEAHARESPSANPTSWANAVCRRLMKQGIVGRNGRGEYIINTIKK